ncbi:MAG: hypothetical protein HFJ60_04545 [Clostridia bacterium]|jgi:hypothetical protein|nr:hypothetical protein [Clostridia bacterium]
MMTLNGKLFYSFVKKNYEKVSEIEGKEEVYCDNNKLVVVVNDAEIGRQIYDIIKFLKNNKVSISTSEISFEVKKYFVDKENTVQIFSTRFSGEKWETLSKIERLKRLVAFVSVMKMKGYILDKAKFRSDKCNSISAFLSFFTLEDGEVDEIIAKGCLIEYIHYVLSDGGDLKEFYEKMHKENKARNILEFPYKFPIIKMCYFYHVYDIMPESVYQVLISEEFEEACSNEVYYANSLLINERECGISSPILEESEEYIIYEGNIKIYKKISSKFEEFMKDDNNLKKYEDDIYEQVERTVIDIRGNIIGYKFLKQELKENNSILEIQFENQASILNFVSFMYDYLQEVTSKKSYIVDRNINCFSVEKSLICIDRYNEKFKITDIRSIYKLLNNSNNGQLLIVFFKLLFQYCKQRYGELKNEKEFLEKDEVRYLPPIVAKEFVKYALDKSTGYGNEVVNIFFNFLCHNKKDFDYPCTCFYDSTFYNPLIIPFEFDYQIKDIYGIDVEKGINQEISHERRIVTFNRSKNLPSEIEKKEKITAEIEKKIFRFEDEHVRFVELSEIIYSTELNSDNMYKFIGYIINNNGKSLTDELLVSLNNKELLKVIAYLFKKFDRYYIPLDTIYMNDNFEFYINIWDEKFKIKRCEYNGTETNFTEMIYQHLIGIGCNPNILISIDFSAGKDWMLSTVNWLNSYCKEHDIYYNNNRSCPICQQTKLHIDSIDEESDVLFEDEYAKYHILKNTYNQDAILKIYKKSLVGIANIEKNIDDIITKRLLPKELNLGQDGFIPDKKVIQNNEFIGCTYTYDFDFGSEFLEKFRDVNIDLSDNQRLKNRARLKCLIRLMLQVQSIVNSGLAFTANPFGNVILNKQYKKQVQILNIDFISKEGDTIETLKWTCEYVSKVISSDTSIEVDISDCSGDFYKLLDRLQNLSEEMTKYCTIHNFYYNKRHILCPKCVEEYQFAQIEEIENNMTEIVSKSTIISKKHENSGGEARIYPYKEGRVAKVFKEEADVNYSLKTVVIVKIIEKRKILEEINNRGYKFKYIIPQEFLVDDEQYNVFGYIMEKVAGKPISDLRDKEVVESYGFTLKDILEILITVGLGIEILHTEANIYIGDLNGSNILFDADKNIYFIDFDGMGVDDIAPECCTDGYIDPVSEKSQNITMKDDWYSYAIQAFQYLTLVHPFDGVYSVIEDDMEIFLEIPEKMEQRISLLGNHEIEVPSIAQSWNWMNEELVNVFLDIFEGENRESIVPYLERQYKSLYESEPYQDLNKVIRINSKFIAKEIKPFGENVEKVINEKAVICVDENENSYVAVLTQNKQYNIHLPETMDIINILISKDENFVFAVYSNKVIAVNLHEDSIIYEGEIQNYKNVVVDGNSLYFIGISNGKEIIFKKEFVIEGTAQEERIEFLANIKTKCFLVKFNSKFVLVKQGANDEDDIYCNSEKFCSIKTSSRNCEYNIIYDETTKMWLVVNSERNGIIIKPNGDFEKIKIKQNVNIQRIVFFKGCIYKLSKGELSITNVTDDQWDKKSMVYDKIMTPNSILYDINTKGFSIITENVLYKICRG